MVKLENVAAKRSKTHQRYYNKAGTMLPGVTTILGVLNKPALVPWANGLGLQGINVREYVDALALVGTVAHDMICAHVKNVKFDPINIPTDILDAAENSFLKYLSWEKNHIVEPILCEMSLVSEENQFGGRVDFYGKINGLYTLEDYKTSKAIWPEHLYQVAAYRHLLVENGYPVDAVGILQIGRSEDEGFSEKVIADSSREWAIFEHCLALYKLGVGKKAA